MNEHIQCPSLEISAESLELLMRKLHFVSEVCNWKSDVCRDGNWEWKIHKILSLSVLCSLCDDKIEHQKEEECLMSLMDIIEGSVNFSYLEWWGIIINVMNP